MSDTPTICPVGERVFLQVRRGPEQTSSGLFIPSGDREKICEVTFAGPDAQIEPGTRVVADPRKCGQVKVQGVQYLVTKASDLLATM